jgi:pSer/pThr/pTyr-binding forkhead associated (FHA) protein
MSLVVIKGKTPGISVILSDSGIVIGRDPTCDLCLEDTSVSRRHARVDLESGQWVVTDLQSSNGVKVNGVRVNTQPLKSGDEITLGDSVLRFLITT